MRWTKLWVIDADYHSISNLFLFKEDTKLEQWPLLRMARTRDLLSFILTAQLIILAGAVIDIIFVTSKREEREMREQQKIFNETVVNFMGGFQEMEWQKVSQLREPPNTEEGREAVVIFEPRSIRPS